MTDEDLRDTAHAWLAEGRRATLVSVVQALGSAPREAGTHMLVATHGVHGTVGGGHLELLAIEQARALLAAPQVLQKHFPLGPALGQCCGGAVTLRWQPLDADALADWPAPAPQPHLQLYGAGHVGRAIARLLAPLPFTVDWVDEREHEFPPEWQPGVPWPGRLRRVAVDGVDAEVALAPPGAAYLVLTHSHDLDLRITEAILQRGDFGFAGLIGSATKRARFERRLAEHGIPAATLARLTCPIGVEGITDKQPEVIALAVVAQLLQWAGSSAGRPQAPSSRAAR